MNSRDEEVSRLIDVVRDGGDEAANAAVELELYVKGGILPADLHRRAKEVLDNLPPHE